MGTYLIHQALTQSLIDLNLGLQIAHENVDFTPPDDEAWLDVTRLPNERTSLTKYELDEETGIYQISYYQPSGASVGDMLQNIDLILQKYQHNTHLVSGDQVVVVVNSGQNEGRNENGWYRIDISVSYKTDIIRV